MRKRNLGLLLVVVVVTFGAVGLRVALGARGFTHLLQAFSDNDASIIPVMFPETSSYQSLSEIGIGKAIVYSPDLAQPGNRLFYEKLGFLYFQTPNWQDVIDGIRLYNASHIKNRINFLILETHGTNGAGLKLQVSYAPRARRSYISVGGLQERLQGSGVENVVVAACNSGRLFRPEIYRTLNPHPNDKLFVPPTLGIINASAAFNPENSDVRMIRRADSHIETTTSGDTSELTPLARKVLAEEPVGVMVGRPVRASGVLSFAVSDMLIQLLLHDPQLKLTDVGFIEIKSKKDYSDIETEKLYSDFLSFLDTIAKREYAGSDAENTALEAGDAEPARIRRPATRRHIVGASASAKRSSVSRPRVD